MTSELTGIEGVQLGILLYHFLHSHLGKTKYIGNVVSGHAAVPAEYCYGTREGGPKPPEISSPSKDLCTNDCCFLHLGKKLLKLTFGIPIEFVRNMLSGIVSSLDFIGR